MKLAEDLRLGGGVQIPFFRSKGISGPEFGQEVIHARDGHAPPLRRLAVRIQAIRKVANAGRLPRVGIREGEGVETTGIVVAWASKQA